MIGIYVGSSGVCASCLVPAIPPAPGQWNGCNEYDKEIQFAIAELFGSSTAFQEPGFVLAFQASAFFRPIFYNWRLGGQTN